VLSLALKWMVALATLVAWNPAAAQFQGARGACSIFIERSLQGEGPATWIDMQAWQVVDNRDGSVSVGARFIAEGARTGRSRYVTCILRQESGSWTLEKLSRLR